MKPVSTHHRDAIAKVAEAIDSALVATVHKMDEDEGHISMDSILLSLAEARAYVVKANLMAILADRVIDVQNDRPRVYADEAPLLKDADPELEAIVRNADKKLPKLKPQGHDKVVYKPGIAKLLRKPIEWDCPKCHAEAGTFCFKFDGPGAHPKLTTERNDGTFFHTMRSDLATKANDRIRQANILK